MPCLDNGCDQNHCGKCGCHTVANQLVAGMCQECFDIDCMNMEQEVLQDFDQDNPIDMTQEEWAELYASMDNFEEFMGHDTSMN